MEGRLKPQNGAIGGNLWTFRSSEKSAGHWRVPSKGCGYPICPSCSLSLCLLCYTLFHNVPLHQIKAMGPSALDVEQRKPSIQILTTLVRPSLQRKANPWKGQNLDFGQSLM